MFELIPSRRMRELFEKEGFRLTDFQCATLIWHALGKSRDEKLVALQELMETTEDEVLCRQIRERIEFEDEKLRRFKDNTAREHVYVGVDDTDSTCGFYAEYDMAKTNLCQRLGKREFTVNLEKQRIVSSEADLRVKFPGRWNPNLFPDMDKEQEIDYTGAAVAVCSFNRDGEIVCFGSGEMTDAENAVADEYSKERFEFAFVPIPFVGRRGTAVKIVGTDNYGVLATDTEEWDELIQDAKNGLYVDYVDMSVTVYFLQTNGEWSHEHVNPIALEFEKPPMMVGDPKSEAYHRAFDAFAEYWSKRTDNREPEPMYGKNVIAWAKEYRDVCRANGNLKSTVVDYARTVRDIMR